MYSALDIDLKPGHGFGIFEIGTSLWTLLDTLRRHPHVYPQIDIKYDPESSPSSLTPIIVHIRPHIDLLFSSKHQRLHTICIRRLRDPNPPVTVYYNDMLLSSEKEVLKRVGVGKAFGPTYPDPGMGNGPGGGTGGGGELRYHGIWFSFDEEHGHAHGHGESVLMDVQGHKKNPSVGDRMQEVKRIIISQKHTGGSPSEVHDALEEVNECPVMAGELARAIVKVHDGVTLYFHPIATISPIHIQLGETTAQDLTLDLGPPLRVHYKDDERMKIHATARSQASEDATDYFYNYFQHGIDFLISGTTHTVRKIILHTNVPGSPLFQRYKRCAWEIEDKPEDDEDDTPPRKRFFDRFETISYFLGQREPPASMVLDRTDEEEDLVLPDPKTQLYGYDGIVLEVAGGSQVVSVMLF